jgi:dTDP-4-amino-4,6-dideoxygalactose transaminase
MIKLYDLQRITHEHADEYKAAMARVIDSGWFLQGDETKQFEHDYARYIGTQHCVAVANGLDALYLILRAYKEMGVMADGDEIIVPANTYIATILAITRNNLKPVLVEPTWHHLELDTDRVEQAITPRTRGIMTVHLYGRLACNEQLLDICHRHHLKLMEDNAQAQGCTFNGKHTGSLGDAAAHSFYPGKNIGAMGDAGAVTTDNAELAATIRALANYGSERKYVFKYAGINSRMSEMDAAVLRIKLKYLDHDNARRQQLADFYYGHISNPLITLPERLPDAHNVYHQFPIFCKERNQLQTFLAQQGVQTLIHYPIPPHKQQCYYEAWGHELSLPVTERIHAEELSIPMSPVVSADEAQQVVDVLNKWQGTSQNVI